METGEAAWLVLRKVDVEIVLLPILVQLAVIVLVARLFGLLARGLRQPAVVGEIVAGLILGPSVLGALFPEVAAALFHPRIHEVSPPVFDLLLHWVFTILSQLGLVFLLFLIGLEFDFAHLRWNGQAAMSISLVGMVLPFLCGIVLAYGMYSFLEVHPETGQKVPLLGFSLFLGTAFSITAIPILGRIMMEMNITRTRLAAITISAAAVDDAAGWILLATVAAIVGGQFTVVATATMVGLTIGFATLLLLLRPLLCRWASGSLQRGQGEVNQTDLAILLVGVLLCACATNAIGIFSIFGAFLLGAVLSGERAFAEGVTRRLQSLVTTFFLPIFFTYTGLRTNIGSLESPMLWLWCVLLAAAAIASKFIGCGLAAWRSGFSLREAACIGAMMNTRALMALIVINLGYEMRVIPPSVFCMLVLMAIFTTLMTTPLLLWFMPGTELEPYISQSDFAQRASADGRRDTTPSGSPQGLDSNAP